MNDEAFEQIVRFLEGAIQTGVESVGLEYKGRDLLVFYQRAWQYRTSHLRGDATHSLPPEERRVALPT